jgi:hypothetical protein
LGTFSVSTTSLSVRLSDLANNYVIADAVVLARVGDLPPTLAVDFPVDEVAEGAGTVLATVSRMPGTSGDLEVSLSSSDLSEATVPATVTILDGQASATFSAAIVDDNVADGTQTVTVTATAGGFVSGSDSLQVTDNERLTIDDGDAGYSDSGAGWSRVAMTQYPGYGGDWRYHAAGDGGSTATWTATGLTAGQYEVLVTWAPYGNRASNAPYRVYDGSASGGALEGTFPINQQMEPRADATAGGRPFQRLGTFTITSGQLSVRLTDLANGYVIADAVQFARVGDVQPTLTVTVVPEQVSESGGTVVGTVTATPPPTGDLVVTLTSSDTSEATVPSTVTILAGQASATFLVPIVDDNVADGNQTSTICATAPGYVSDCDTFIVTDNELLTIDDGDPGYTESGAPWTRVSMSQYPGYAGSGDPSYGDWRYRTPGSGANVATWSAAGLVPGQYDVFVTWMSYSGFATNARYNVYDGGVVEGSFTINQQIPPRADVTSGGRPFQRLGEFSINATTLSVTLSDLANGYVIADAVMFSRRGDLVNSLVVEIPVPAVSEAAGTTTATVTRAPGTVGDLVVSLTSSDTSEATVPPNVTILNGQSSATFDVTPVNDNVADGTQTVTITAAATGFVSGADTLQVLDDEIVTIDDGDPVGFSLSGPSPWVAVSLAEWPGYTGVGDPSYGDWRYHAWGSGANLATWSAPVTPGRYEVLVTWVPYNNRATNAPYSVYDGAVAPANLEGTFPINQQNAPRPDATSGGRPFQRLGVFNISATTASVTLSDNANNYVIADAVQFMRVGDLPLRAAGGVAGDAGGATAEPLTGDETQPLLAEAAARWQAAGLDGASAENVQLVIADLPDDLLGLASSSTNTIWLDADAAGYGWFADATPWDDAEFAEDDDQEVAGRMDALSVIFHELGHLQGLSDVDAVLHRDDPMADALAAGVRRTSGDAGAADHDAALLRLLNEIA